MSSSRSEYQRLNENEENALSRLLPAVEEELEDSITVSMYLEGTDVVNELKENIRISREQFDAIIAMYKKTLAGSTAMRNSLKILRWHPDPSPDHRSSPPASDHTSDSEPV
ncbi:hypothetical protein CSPX01_00635 [Colletotrichum filicis]|nr:hypothetical protein CSPX01_00635 [Colletotrichum filicis]